MALMINGVDISITKIYTRYMRDTTTQTLKAILTKMEARRHYIILILADSASGLHSDTVVAYLKEELAELNEQIDILTYEVSK